MNDMSIDPDIPRIFHDEIAWKVKDLMQKHKNKANTENHRIISIYYGSRIEVKKRDG